jgi:hypothetical protein
MRDRRWTWDFALMMLTVAALAGLGLQSFVGTLFSWWAERTDPPWSAVSYESYVGVMNAVAAPLVVSLVVLLGLCIPKRVLERRALAIASAALLASGALAWLITGDPAIGLAAYLAAAGLFQVVVLAMTFADRPSLRYLTEGRLVRLGSGLLHLGFIAFAFVVVALQDSPWMLPVFWLSAGLLVAGSTMSFYADSLATLGTGRSNAEADSVPADGEDT